MIEGSRSRAIQRVRELVAEMLCVDVSLISDDLVIADAGLSSLQLMELVYEVEDEFGVVVVDESVASLTTVRDIVTLAETLIAQDP